MGDDASWASASDLADYEYCPRAHWYHDHPPRGGPTPDARDRATAGTRYHSRVLGAERRREELGGGYWIVLAVGALLAVGGAAWVFLH
ncbi:MAG: hypothetical protein WA547_02720 [Thermoplasmata archaeon]